MNGIFRWIAGLAKRARMAAAIGIAVVTVVLLCLPMAVALAKLSPNQLFTMQYGLDFDAFREPSSRLEMPIVASGGGTALSLHIRQQQSAQSQGAPLVQVQASPLSDEAIEASRPAFCFTPKAIAFVDGATTLRAPIQRFSAIEVQQRDFSSIFDGIAQENGYPRRLLLWMMVLRVAAVGAALAGLVLAMGLLLGIQGIAPGQAYSVRVKCAAWSLLLPALLCLPLGLIQPTIPWILVPILAIPIGLLAAKQL